jgi:uncharacterized protein (DUF58 family)
VTQKVIDKQHAITLRVKKYVLGNFLGPYRSLFRGKGMDYDEIRKYVPGDDPKSLVWAKLAQLGEPYVKTFLEERDLSVIVAVDISGSVFWARPAKAQLALELAATLIFSAAMSRDRVGLALFSDDLQEFLPPRRGLSHAGRLVERLALIGVGQRRTRLAQSFHSIGARRGPKRAVVAVISDFVSDDDGWTDAMASLAKHNDLIAVKVTDRWEDQPPAVGWITAEDAETGKQQVLCCDTLFASEFRGHSAVLREELCSCVAHNNIGLVEVHEGENPVLALKSFFERRQRFLLRGGT